MPLDNDRLTRQEERLASLTREVAEIRRIVYGAVATIVGAVLLAIVASVLRSGGLP